MKILVISDIHANIEALMAVLDAEKNNYQGFIFLGDVTGYGPDPEPCIKCLYDLQLRFSFGYILAGNHDAALSGKVPLRWFNENAQKSVLRARKKLSNESLEWLSSLSSYEEVIDSEIKHSVIAVHGSPLEPVTEYLLGDSETFFSLQFMKEQKIDLCFAGHTHQVAIFSMEGEKENVGQSSFSTQFPISGTMMILEKKPVIINPGSVGFPRAFNGIKKPFHFSSYPAYYLIWDTDTMEICFKEVLYDRRPVEKKMKKNFKNVS